jgi:hypothetical protein
MPAAWRVIRQSALRWAGRLLTVRPLDEPIDRSRAAWLSADTSRGLAHDQVHARNLPTERRRAFGMDSSISATANAREGDPRRLVACHIHALSRFNI